MANLFKKNGFLKISLILLVLFLSVILLYSPHLKKNFGRGDNLEWYQEAKERNTFAKIFDFNYYSGRLGPSAYFNPVQLTVWHYIIEAYGQKPYPYYFLCILIHITNVALSFFLINSFIKSKFFSFLASLSFAVFYLNFLTVGWMAAGITTGLSAFFFLIIFFLFLKYLQTKNIFLYFLSLLFFLIGTFTKETVVFAIPILLAYYVLIIKEKTLKFTKNDLFILPYFILSLPIILITLLRLNKSAITNVWGEVNFGIHIFYRFIDFFGYLISVVPVSIDGQLAVALLALLLLPLLIYLGKNKTLLFLIIWLVLSILIYTYSNFRGIYSLGRYLYLPSIAWFTTLYYIAANIKNLKTKIITTFFLIDYTIVLNIFLILTRK